MAALMKLFASGYLVGIACMVYLSVRSWRKRSRQSGVEERASVNWLGMVLFSTGVAYAWSLVGAGFHFIVQNDELFIQCSLLLAVIMTAMLIFASPKNKLDKIALNSIIFGGMGVLIPLIF